jgi:hypothetical protein
MGVLELSMRSFELITALTLLPSYHRAVNSGSRMVQNHLPPEHRKHGEAVNLGMHLQRLCRRPRFPVRQDRMTSPIGCRRLEADSRPPQFCEAPTSHGAIIMGDEQGFMDVRVILPFLFHAHRGKADRLKQPFPNGGQLLCWLLKLC